MKSKRSIIRIVISLLVLLIIMIPIVTFADNFDIIELATGERYDYQEWMFDPEMFTDIMFSPSDYSLEWGAEDYHVADILSSPDKDKSIAVLIGNLCSIREKNEAAKLQTEINKLPKVKNLMNAQNWTKLAEHQNSYGALKDKQKKLVNFSQANWTKPGTVFKLLEVK